MTEAVQAAGLAQAEHDVLLAAHKLAEANGAVAALHAAYQKALAEQKAAMQGWKDAKVWEAIEVAAVAGATNEEALAAGKKVAAGIVVL